MFEKRILIETYFDESVHGLDIGTVVKYRGVPVGTIKSISFVQNVYSNTELGKDYSKGKYVLVILSMKDIFYVPDEQFEEVLVGMIQEGLRVKITSQGLTGISFLELDYVTPDIAPEIQFNWKPKHPYIPSTKSTFKRIGASIDEIIQKIDRANIDKFIINLDRLATTLEKGIQDANLSELGKNSNSLIMELRETNQDIRKILNSQKTQKLPEKIDDTLTNVNKSMTKLNQILSNNQMEISTTIENLKIVSQDLREVSNNAKKYPSQLLFGDAPNSPITGKK